MEGKCTFSINFYRSTYPSYKNIYIHVFEYQKWSTRYIKFTDAPSYASISMVLKNKYAVFTKIKFLWECSIYSTQARKLLQHLSITKSLMKWFIIFSQFVRKCLFFLYFQPILEVDHHLCYGVRQMKGYLPLWFGIKSYVSIIYYTLRTTMMMKHKVRGRK